MKNEGSVTEVLNELGGTIKHLEAVIEKCSVALQACKRSHDEGLSFPDVLVDHCLVECEKVGKST